MDWLIKIWKAWVDLAWAWKMSQRRRKACAGELNLYKEPGLAHSAGKALREIFDGGEN